MDEAIITRPEENEMGSPQRAIIISEDVSDPIMKRVVKRAFGGCGNCRKRVLCSSRIIDIDKAVESLKALLYRTFDNIKPGLAAETIAGILKDKCGKCDHFERCLTYWLNVNKIDDAERIVEDVKAMSRRDDLPVLIESIMRDQGLTTGNLLRRVGSMWWNCDKGKCYETAVTVQDAS
jgi:hypothetical protein